MAREAPLDRVDKSPQAEARAKEAERVQLGLPQAAGHLAERPVAAQPALEVAAQLALEAAALPAKRPAQEVAERPVLEDRSRH